MNIAVTGASGHIGNCLVKELKTGGARIKVLVHHFENDLDQLNVELVYGNLLRPDSLNRLCEGVDIVFHLAAQIAIDNKNYKKVYATNVTGTKNIIEAAKKAGVKKFIHFSSIHAFNTNPAEAILDEKRSLIESKKGVYEYTKAESERVVLKAVREGFNAVILSPTAVIGPEDFRGSFLGKALLQIYRNKLPMLVSGGYNFVDVRDVVSAAVQAIERGRAGEKYILSGNYYSLKELSKEIAKISGGKTPTFVVPVFIARLASPFIQLFSTLTKKDPLYTNQSLNILANSPKKISFNKAQTELNFNPRHLEETLKDTFTWYKQNNNLI